MCIIFKPIIEARRKVGGLGQGAQKKRFICESVRCSCSSPKNRSTSTQAANPIARMLAIQRDSQKLQKRRRGDRKVLSRQF
jgi:hypothetical protein